MKKFLFLMLLILCVSAGYCEQIANIHRISKAPVIDGVLDDECYKTASYISNFLNLSDSSIGEIKDKVYVGYDDQNMYFGIYSVCPHLAAGVINKKNGSVWSDDDIEIYINPFGGNTNYFMFAMNGANSLYMSMGTSMWLETVQYKSIKTDYGWSGEIAIPLKEIKMEKLQPVRFNISGAKRSDAKLFTWSDLYGGTFHNPSRFGTLTFDENIPSVRIEDISLNDKTILVKGSADSGLDYSIKLKEQVKSGKTDKNMDIKETFDDLSGLFRLTFEKDGKTVYQSDFSICAFRLFTEQNKNRLKVVADLSNAVISKYQKVEIRLEEVNKSALLHDSRIWYGETITFTEPYKKEYNWTLPHKGEYRAVLEVWSFNGLSKRLEEKIVY